MNYRDLLNSGANVSVTLKLEDLREIFREMAGSLKAVPKDPPSEEFLAVKRFCLFLKLILLLYGVGRKQVTSNHFHLEDESGINL